MKKFLVLAALALFSCNAAAAMTNAPPDSTISHATPRLLRPLSMADALDMALQQNSTIRKGRADLEASHGIVVQTRAIALPKLAISSSYSANEEDSTDRLQGTVSVPGVTNINFADTFDYADQRWSAGIRIMQSIYEGGRINAALRSARLTREHALLSHQTVIADALRDVRVAYYNVLSAQQQITVQEASLNLLQQELDEMGRRFTAGTVPRFNVLRAEVEVANSRPKLIRARNAFRISKDNLANLLGEKIPREMEEAPLQLTGKLEATPFEVSLPDALGKAFEQRTELAALRKVEALRTEAIANARSGYKPSVQLFAGYGARSSQFSSDLTEELHGWEAGAQLSWNVFDGFLTKGRVQEAEGLRNRTREELAEAERSVELDVRTAYSFFTEAREVLRSQEKVQESADESLRLATARATAGAATQLDVLNAQTALTEARTTQVLALHGYAVARARLERAIGQPIATEGKP
ncbi:MAG TPA: TolC family protein [Methylomirabilota bacterium]|nr:TolC family protein [Methylomirabilota bacterium]